MFYTPIKFYIVEGVSEKRRNIHYFVFPQKCTLKEILFDVFNSVIKHIYFIIEIKIKSLNFEKII